MSEQRWVYVVTDIEVDGPWPGPNSMRSFASVATTVAGEVVGEFEGVCEPLAGAAPNPDTKAWFDAQPPEVWAAATENARPAGEVMQGWASWVLALPGRHLFAARPLAFDGTWIDYYLRRFTSYGLVQGPYETARLFDGPALCLASLMAGVTGVELGDLPRDLPAEALAGVEHTHRAIDDARGYAHLLAYLQDAANPPRLVLP